MEQISKKSSDGISESAFAKERKLAKIEIMSHRAWMKEIISKHGERVSEYPSHHPLIINQDTDTNIPTVPSEFCGYEGLGECIFFKNAFLTYFEASDLRAMDIFDSVYKMNFRRSPSYDVAIINAEEISNKFNMNKFQFIFISCVYKYQTSKKVYDFLFKKMKNHEQKLIKK